jgi:hypothetical protein
MNSWLSILLYFFVFAFSAVFIDFGIHKAPSIKYLKIINFKLQFNVWTSLGLLLPISLGFLRYGMGIDYASYLEIYQYFADGRVVDWHVDNISRIELFFQWLAKFSHFTTNTPIIFFGIAWTLTILFVFYGIKRWSTNLDQKFFPLVWFMVLPIITAIGFNQVRQMLAIAILFYSSVYLLKMNIKNIIKYFFFGICAVFCHRSALLVLSLLLIIRLSIIQGNKRPGTTYTLIKILIISLIPALIITLYAIASSIQLPYLDEFTRLLFINGNVRGNIFGIADIRPENLILISIFLPALLWCIHEKANNDDLYFRLLSLFTGLGFILTTLSFFIMNGERVAQYFILYPVIVYYVYLAKPFSKIKISLPLILLFMIMVLGWQGVVPYHSLFEKKVDINAINSLSVRPPYSQVLCSTGVISCRDKIYFDNKVRDSFYYEEGYIWKP